MYFLTIEFAVFPLGLDDELLVLVVFSVRDPRRVVVHQALEVVVLLPYSVFFPVRPLSLVALRAVVVLSFVKDHRPVIPNALAVVYVAFPLSVVLETPVVVVNCLLVMFVRVFHDHCVGRGRSKVSKKKQGAYHFLIL